MGERRRYHSFVSDSRRWDGFEFRPGDIVISTPPKCGTTWMQMMCALLIFRTPDLPAPLSTLSPWLDMQTRPLEDVERDLAAQTHRRFMKTHTPLDGLPWSPDVTYVHVARDPRDVALSWDNHMANMDMERFVTTRLSAVTDDLAELGPLDPPKPPPDDPLDRFWQWVEGEGMGGDTFALASMVHHVQTFWERRHERNVHLFHYRDLRVDLAGEMRRLASALGLEPPGEELVEAATFERMKERADHLAPNVDTPFWRDNSQFFDRARSEGWRDLLDDAGRQRYDKTVAALGPPDLVEWLHHGSGQSVTP